MPRPKNKPLPKKQPHAPIVFSDERKERFLAELREVGFQNAAAERVGIDPRTVRTHMAQDPEFKERYIEAQKDFTEIKIMGEVIRRGVQGVSKPIIGGKDRDQVVLHVQEYSDRLLEKLANMGNETFARGAGADGPGGGGPGGAGGVLMIPNRVDSIDEWARAYGEAAKGTTGRLVKDSA